MAVSTDVWQFDCGHGPTVIVPLLRTVRPTARLANILRWEGILIDPLGALFVVMVYEFIVSSSHAHSLEVFSLIYWSVFHWYRFWSSGGGGTA